ncbi:ER membrane protein complex subunit 1, putative [Plasmodium knowlesi strain H]|uniref:ER membrane protein complex subunit 1 n=3 Tax=Plasmodium knowlesi TaxID=5850 RepID=A0A5K1V9G8_PLAKH|nr:ER membrane protein complex subunit 1, putative [Plasmodium knowlesi strain H]OTN64122.1 putative ER membrane protein complex subunit 1 [Plasmodium knowlesi]CAA9990892.1 ER membrane protein complex subunit 1, putative [Plasmodium knowlesi strain H]SBO20884.1 ER membrane protein complex subunit 1, putative [Plasmodium knowlesi strain H]SBO21338.1 ER membrane protein complex subunit 1, putative [Plasmodium knowlesi strain H]VVS80366.1 ER membrane protein complex subunit 1, putative [Plasmodiu|eukprot:XP_002262178.1 hypothetical protein, conserved in Plasmodium species [Plasmodium knowlesi strain H]
MWFHFFLCFVALLTKLTFEKHIPYSNIASVIGHINYIVPTSNLLNSSVLLSSFNGNVGFLNYKTGTLDYVQNHRENEKIKKLHGDDGYAAVLIYRDPSEENEVEGNYTNDGEPYSYINVYSTMDTHLLSSFEYKNEIIEDFLINEEKIFILLHNRIDIGNIGERKVNSLIFQELNLNSIYARIIAVSNVSISLFYVDAELGGHIVRINIVNKNLENDVKINKLQMNDKMVNYVNVVNNGNVIVVYNKELLQWVELAEGGNNYDYGSVSIGGHDKKAENEETNERANYANTKETIPKHKLLRDDFMAQWNTENCFVIKLGEKQLVYTYNDKKMRLIKGKNKNEVIGYYINQYKEKDIIFAEDKENQIIIKKAEEQGIVTLNVLNKSSNVYYNAEMIIGLHNKEDNANYFFSVYSDSTLTVYKNEHVHYSREESLAYVEQLHFYNFQHLKKKKSAKHSYDTTQFHLMKELESYIKDKINSFNKPFLEEVMKRKAEKSLLPFNFFYLSHEDKMNLLNICMEKKKKADSLANYGMERKPSYSMNSRGDTYDMHSGDHTSNLMNEMIENSFKKYEQNQSGKYAGSSVIIVATRNNFIFAIHLYTGLILYKIDGNQFKDTKEIFSPKWNFDMVFSLNKDNWSELDNGKKIIFLNNQKECDTLESNLTSKRQPSKTPPMTKGVLNYSNGVHLFKSFTKDTVITIFKGENFAHIIIFDILSGLIIFEEKLNSFEIKNIFIDRKGSSIVLVDNSLNVKVVAVPGGGVTDATEDDLFFYRINGSRNFIEGFKLMSYPRKKGPGKEMGLIQTYSINLHNEKLEVFSKSITKKDTFYPIKINKDASICYKYVNDNIISYITSTKQKEGIIYTLYIIDGITGDLIISKMLDKHTNPPFHLMISENFVILNYFNTNLKKYIIQVIEILLDKKDPGFFNLITSKKEKIVDLFDQKKKIVVNEKNYIIDHNVKSFNFTETKRGITNKHILLLLDSNKITSLNLGPEKEQNVYKNLNSFITQTDILYNSRGFISNESLLESTTLVFSWGNYLYFTCYQPNGSFDTIENFNLLLLLFLIILVFIGTYISYIRRINKTVYSKWA